MVPPRAPANADAEITRLRQILGGPPGEVISHLDELLDVLDRGPDAGMLHFACHNTFSSEGGSSITMDGGPFLPQMLNRAVTRRSLYDHHPLVFINACRSAGAAPEYTRMMSWADQFMRAGAGAFIGTLWPVNSDRAAEFAEAFYAEMAGGAQLGPATMVARAATERGGDPTWLAYSAYGDPAATAA
ncbi:CHAT domain-containing protein [Paractinoplanes durhamensis]|uniref:CHAT domain-containing protein n=1 Tax=Paractinoplanes durhamensis TaxID=113563 RepID=UPI0036280E1E